MKVLVIPDCHLKPWMFAQADAIVKKGIADKAVCLMDLADDFGVHDDAQYLETYETAIAFAKEHPDTLWCYGNHDLSYIWGKPETGYHPEKRGLVCQEIKKLTNTLSNGETKDSISTRMMQLLWATNVILISSKLLPLVLVQARQRE